MQTRSWMTAAAAVLALMACATQEPGLTYDAFLPNTNENPAWARQGAQRAAADQAQSTGTSAAPR